MQINNAARPQSNDPVALPAPNELVQSATENQQLLKVCEAARIMNMSETWVYLNYKSLPHVLIGTGSKPRIRFRRKALLAWIEQHEID